MNHSGNKLFAVCCLMVSLNVEVMLTSSEPVFVVVISDVIATNNQNIVPILKEITSYKRPKSLQFVTVVFKNDTEALDTVCSLISSGAAGLIDLSSPKLSPLLLALSKDLGVAYISVVDSSYYYYYHFMSDRFVSNGTNLSVEPASSQMLKIAVDIADREKLNSVALFYDDTFDIQNTPRRVLTNVPVPHIYLPLSSNTSQTERQIDTLIKINIKTVLIIADRFSAQSFLSVLTRKRIVNFDPSVFVLTKDAKLYCPSCQGSLRLLLITAQQSTQPQLEFIEFMHASRIDQRSGDGHN
ncbi:hypothetical protein Btru_059803 [Bulinus truncatus]|nr:hypothetical protein Btru_059803 [Bulinus truncatus]